MEPTEQLIQLNMDPQVVYSVVGTLVGIVVTVVLSMFAYRKTIGARQERVRLANASIHRALVRRMVLDGYKPTFGDLRQLKEGKAREFRIRSGDLLSVTETTSNLFADFFDNDLIVQSLRDELLSNLALIHERQPIERESSTPQQSVRVPTPASDSLHYSSSHAERESDSLLAAEHLFGLMMGRLIRFIPLSASLLGATTALFITTLSPTGFDFPSVLVTMLSSFVVGLILSAFYLFYRGFRDAPSEPTRQPRSRAAANLENEVLNVFFEMGIEYETGEIEGFQVGDFIIKHDSQIIAVQLWPSYGTPTMRDLTRVMASMKRDMAYILYQAVQQVNKGIIVTPDIKRFPENVMKSGNVEVVDLKGLREYFEASNGAGDSSQGD